MPKLRLTQTGSAIGQSPRHRGTLRALGLGRIGKTREHDDNPVIAGMLRKVRHLATHEAGAHHVRARTRLLALDPATRVAALARAHAAAHALAFHALLRRLQIREIQIFRHYASSTLTRCRTLRSMPAITGLSSWSRVLPMRPRPSARSVP